MNVFGVVVMGLGNVGALVPAITALCENHVRYGVQLADYTTLSIAVSSSFRQVCTRSILPCSNFPVGWTDSVTPYMGVACPTMRVARGFRLSLVISICVFHGPS